MTALTPAPRKVVQIVGVGVNNTSRTQTDAILVAVCDDGSIWATDAPFTKWDRLPNVPQED